jgi:hypothetical protein
MRGDGNTETETDTKTNTNLNLNTNLNTGTYWWASLWLSASCCWSCWPYSQLRTGVVNRLPGIVSNRTPLAHVRHPCHGAYAMYFGI